MAIDAMNVFVLGLDDLHLRQLLELRRADEYRFHELYRKKDVKSGRLDVADRVLDGARRILADFPDPIDAIVGYWDFPVSTMLPILRREHGLPGPTLEAVLRCEHKYWSRLEQAEIVPDIIPEFCPVDPFATDVADQITLPFPFWIKPVRSVLSHLGFRVADRTELDSAISEIRAGIDRIAVPFDHLLAYADLPDALAGMSGRHCIAEAIISRGRQCTLEGFAHDGDVVVYGAVDSIREGRHRSSFSRYQYPSNLPSPVLDRMIEATRRFISHIGFDDSPFNIEFYWDDVDDRIWLLEVNTRISKSHAPLLRNVDGEYHHQVMLDVAVGRRPDPPHREGPYPISAKFMWRVDGDAVVTRAPDPETIEDIRRELPGAEIELHIRQGMRLSELAYQNSYSYEIAAIHLGGHNEANLLESYARCRKALDVGLEPVVMP